MQGARIRTVLRRSNCQPRGFFVNCLHLLLRQGTRIFGIFLIAVNTLGRAEGAHAHGRIPGLKTLERTTTLAMACSPFFLAVGLPPQFGRACAAQTTGGECHVLMRDCRKKLREAAGKRRDAALLICNMLRPVLFNVLVYRQAW